MPKRSVDEDMDCDISGWRGDGRTVNPENLSHNCLSGSVAAADRPWFAAFVVIAAFQPVYLASLAKCIIGELRRYFTVVTMA
jgi:hypothetical protein